MYQEETVDLLNLNSLNIEAGDTPKPSPSTNFDLLSGLSDEPTESFTDFIGSTTNKAQNDIFDPFAATSESSENNLFEGWNDTNSNVKSQKPNDIFGGLGKNHH